VGGGYIGRTNRQRLQRALLWEPQPPNVSSALAWAVPTGHQAFFPLSSLDPRESATQPSSLSAPYPPNLSTMALRFCARGPLGLAGADTLRSGALSFFFSSEGGDSVGLWGTSLGEDSLHGEVGRSVRGDGTTSVLQEGAVRLVGLGSLWAQQLWGL
jgi:hypothetical protein